MADFYFFTEPDKLTVQVNGESFGPAGSVVGGTDAFNISSVHQSNVSLKAFAICNGNICVQEVNQSTVNLILKPTQQPENDLPFIAYYIYKGVKSSSLWDNAGKILGSGNDLVELIQKSADANNVPDKNTLGSNLTNSKNPSLYADIEPIDNLFYKGDSNYPLHYVHGGMYLGDFTTSPGKFGLTIIVERIGYRPSIGLAREIENQVKVPSYSGPVSPPNNATYFEHWHKKEEILNFIDPCSFWGSFGEKQLKTWDSSSGKHKSLTYAEVYTKILKGPSGANFINRNAILLDIRSEHSGSLNYYKNYGNTIQISTDVGSTFADIDYYQAGWPWYLVSIPAGLTSGQTTVKLEIGLPKSDNTLPLVYLSQIPGTEPLSDSTRFQSVHRLSYSDYVSPIRLTIPIITDGAPCFRAAIARLMYLRQIDKRDYINPPTLAATTLPYKEHLDNIFQPFVMNLPFDRGSNLGIKIYGQEVFVDKTHIDGTKYIGYIGICEDQSDITFFVIPMRSTGRSTLASSKGYPKLTAADSFGIAQSFLEYLMKMYGYFFAKHENSLNGQAVSTYSILNEENKFEHPSVIIISRSKLNISKNAISTLMNVEYGIFLSMKEGVGFDSPDNSKVFEQQLAGFGKTSLVESINFSMQEKSLTYGNF